MEYVLIPIKIRAVEAGLLIKLIKDSRTIILARIIESSLFICVITILWASLVSHWIVNPSVR